MKLVAMVAALGLMAAGVSAQQKAGGGDEAAIVKIRTAYQTAAGSADGAAIAKLYAPDGQELPPNAPAAKGRAAIEAFHKAFAQQFMMHGIHHQRELRCTATSPATALLSNADGDERGATIDDRSSKSCQESGAATGDPHSITTATCRHRRRACQ